MRVWLDNTGVPSAGTCIDRTARSDTNILGLFQLATFSVFSDQLWANGFEPSLIADRTKDIVDRIQEGRQKMALRIAALWAKWLSGAVVSVRSPVSHTSVSVGELEARQRLVPGARWRAYPGMTRA